jgi:hypothetical protein
MRLCTINTYFFLLRKTKATIKQSNSQLNNRSNREKLLKEKAVKLQEEVMAGMKEK